MLRQLLAAAEAAVRDAESAALVNVASHLTVFWAHNLLLALATRYGLFARYKIQDPQRFPQSFTMNMPNQVKVKTTKQLMSKQMPKMESRMNCKPRTALPRAAADCRARAVQRL